MGFCSAGSTKLSSVSVDCDLAMGAHNITISGGLIDGITPSAHEDRHVSGGPDDIDSALATGALFEHGHAKHTNRTRRIFIPFSAYQSGGAFGAEESYAIVLLDTDGDYAVANFVIPKDYINGAKIFVVYEPVTSGDVIVDMRARWAASGEDKDTNYDINVNMTLAGTLDYLYITDSGLDLETSPSTGNPIEVDDIVGIKFEEDTGVHVNFHGFIFEYNADM